jgi:hypothetical protein
MAGRQELGERMKKSSLYLAIALFLLLSSSVSAKEYPYIYRGIRPMGMGGAFVAVSDDENALFYNPAGLSQVPEDTKVKAVSAEIELSEGAYGAFKDAWDLDTSNTQETASFLRNYIGSYHHASATIFPYFLKQNLAFGIIGTQKTGFTAHDYQDPSLHIDNIQDAGVAVGYAQSFDDEELSIGVNGKFLLRNSLNKDYSLAEITDSDFSFSDKLTGDAQKGAGALLDIGLLYHLTDITSGRSKIKTLVGLSVSNLIGSSMGNASNLSPHADFGFALKADNVTFALDYVDILRNFTSDNDLPKRIHVGAEYIYEKIYALRAGLNQGYITYGIGLNGEKVTLDFLSYAEEMGTYSGQQRNRRYTLSCTFKF